MGVMAAERRPSGLGAKQRRHRIVAACAASAALCFCIVAITSGITERSVGLENTAGGPAPALRGKGGGRGAARLQGVEHMLARLGDIISRERQPSPAGVLAVEPGKADSARSSSADRMGGVREEELMEDVPHSRLRSVVMMLASEVKTPGVCDKKAKILEKLEALLKRLGGRARTVNATDETYEHEAQTALTVWLEVETLYRMSEEKYDEATQSEQFVMHQLEVAQRVEDLTKKDVATVIEEYPGKKGEINEEKTLVVELIKMVENITFSGPGEESSKAAPSQLTYIRSEISSLEERSRPLKLKAEFAKLENVKNQLASIGAGLTAPTTTTTKLGVTAQDVQVTKSAVIKILMELLKEPDFREHLLELGLRAAQAQAAKDSAAVTELEKKEVALASIADKAEHEVDVTEMQRNKDAGDKLSKEEAFVTEHKDFIAQSESNTKGSFIIQTIIDKINEFCDKQPAGDQAQPTGAAAKAAIRPLLAAAEAAAEAAWRTGGR